MSQELSPWPILELQTQVLPASRQRPRVATAEHSYTIYFTTENSHTIYFTTAPFIARRAYIKFLMLLAFLGLTVVKGGSQFFINVAHNDFLDWFSPGATCPPARSPLSSHYPQTTPLPSPASSLVALY